MFNALRPSDAYYLNWLELRWRRRLVWFSFLAVPLALVAGGAAELLHPLLGIGAMLAVLGPTLMLAYCRAAYWPCPRCGRPFYVGGRRRLLQGYVFYADNCGHCGLAEYGPNEAR